MVYPINKPCQAPSGLRKGAEFKGRVSYTWQGSKITYEGPFLVLGIMPSKGLMVSSVEAVNTLGHCLSFYML